MAAGEFWVISAASRTSPPPLLTVECGEGAALAVFGFREEAAMFLALGGFERGWSVREMTVPELLYVLDEPRGSTGRIVLDPLPHPPGVHGGLPFMSREEFTEFLVRRVRLADRSVAAKTPGEGTRPRHATFEEQEITGE